MPSEVAATMAGQSKVGEGAAVGGLPPAKMEGIEDSIF
jgi:hypothetical protein